MKISRGISNFLEELSSLYNSIVFLYFFADQWIVLQFSQVETLSEVWMKKEFIGPGLHLRPVQADHAQPPFRWTLNSVFSAYEHNNRRVRPPPDRGALKMVSRLLIA